jgi:GGDEF domain-containing protein
MAVSLHRESDQDARKRSSVILENGAKEFAQQLGRLLEVLAQEAVSVDQTEAGEHKARLRELATRIVVNPAKPGVVWQPDLERQLTVELHTYRETIEKKIDQLQKDLASTADAMQEYVTRFAGQDQDQEKLLHSDLERLNALRRITNLNQIHAGLDVVRESILGTVEQIRAQNQAIIAQLRDEIRTLHKRLDGPHRRDEAGTLASRAPFERRIRAKVENHETFSLYLVRITNWKDIIGSLGQEDAQSLVNNVSERLASNLGPDTFSGRWYDGYFAAILALDKRAAMEGASQLAQQMAGIYMAGPAQVAVRIRVAVVDYIHGQDADQTLRRVEQLIRAFEG